MRAVTRIAVAGPNAHSTEAGGAVATLGGNAVDVALAAMFAALVSEPSISSLGGGAFVTVAPPDGPAITVDGSVAMAGTGLPAEAFGRGLEPLFMEYGGGTTTDIGAGSVGVPGTLTAMETAHRRFGTVPWAQVVAPAATLAREGFRVGRAAGHYLGYSAGPLFGRDPSIRASLTGPSGAVLKTGDTMYLPELGDFLDRVAVEGAAALMRGDTAKEMVAELAAGEGLLTIADLENYRAVVRPALVTTIDDWTWATNPPPAVGGSVLTALLLLGDVELIEAQRAVLSYRVKELDLSRDRVKAAERMLTAIRAGGTAWLNGAPSTVHVSAVDAEGGACAITASAGYGSGLAAPGSGIWLNNCLGERELNRLGPHALAPGERIVSNMTPTVGRSREGAVLAIGSPGADRIATAVFQTLLGLQAGQTLAAAVERPRVHVSCDDAGVPVTLEYEADYRLTPGDAPDLPRREHLARSMFFGGVAAAIRRASGELEAAADPRREGSVLVQ